MRHLVKKNERIIWVILLVLLAPSFAFTGLMGQYFGRRGGAEVYKVYGETLTDHQLNEVQTRQTLIQHILAAGQHRQMQRGMVPAEEALDALMTERLAGDCGLAVSDEELSKAVRSYVQQWVGFNEALKEINARREVPQSEQNEILEKAQANARFTSDAYSQMLRDENMGLKMKTELFEATLRHHLLQMKLYQLVVGATLVSERELYDEFNGEQQRRAFDYLRAPTAPFLGEAKGKVTEEEIEAAYEADSNKFKIPARVQFEAYKLHRDEFLKLNAPTEDEIAKRYEADKEPRYQKPKTPPAKPPASAAEPAPEEAKVYLPLEEVKDQVKTSVVETKEKEFLQRIIKAGMELRKTPPADGNTKVDLEQLLGADAHLVEVLTSGLTNLDEIKDLDKRISNRQAVSSLLSKLKRGLLKENDYSSDVATADDGSFALRVLKFEKESVPPLADCREKVVEEAAKTKARELARDLLKTLKQRVDTKQATLEEVAKENNYEVKTTAAVKKTEWGNVKEAAAPLPGARELVTEGFKIPEIGGVGEVVFPTNKSVTDVYLVRLKEIQLPEASEYTEQLRKQLLGTKQQSKARAIMEEFKRAQESKAQIQRLYEKKTSTASS